MGVYQASLRVFPCLPDARRFSSRITHPLGEGADVGEDGVDEAGLGGVVGVEVEGEALDEGGADDGSVGGARHFGGLLRSADAEADGDRQSGETAQPRDRGGDISGLGRAGAGDPGDRDVIDEAGRMLDDARQAPVVVARRMKSRLAARAGPVSSASSSGGRSTTMTPSTPAATASCAKLLGP